MGIWCGRMGGMGIERCGTGEVGLGKGLLMSRRGGMSLCEDWEGGAGSGMRQLKVGATMGHSVSEGILEHPTFWKWFWGTPQFLGDS